MNHPDGTDIEAATVAAARAFAAEVVDPAAAEWERDRRWPAEAFRAAADAGLCGLLVPRGMGGRGLGTSGMCGVLSALAAADMGFAFSLVCHNNLEGAIAKRGTTAQKDRYLARMMAGELLGGFLLTEPTGGSDAAAIRTTATRDADGWRLDGEKAWCTNGTHAGLVNVYVQTEPGTGARGIAAFLVETDQPGVTRLPGYEMMGAHSTGANGFCFEGVRLSDDQLFIPPGEAFRAAMEAIDIARIVVAAMCAGMLARGIAAATAFLKGRHAFGGPLSDQQALRFLVADAATDLEAMRALTEAAGAAFDARAADAGVMAAHAKKFATRQALARLLDCMQALGAPGFRQDQPLARHVAGAKMAAYLDGTTEIQNVVIARSLFGR